MSTSKPILAQLSDVTKRYGKIVALDGMHLDVTGGELLALLGPNGAGKSTAIALLLGLQKPDGGVARLFSGSPQQVSVRRRIGVMMQEAMLVPELRVREHIELVSSYYPQPMTAAESMRLTQTTALADRPYGKLSGGQKRVVQFALAVCGRPALVFLDEPTTGLDVKARETLWTAVRQIVRDGCSVLLTTHYLEEAEALADRVLVMARGKVIASGTVREVSAIVSRKRIDCITALSSVTVEEWPEVIAARYEGQRLQITTTDAEQVARRLLMADETVRELEIHRAGLAEAFSELTHEEGVS